MMPPRECLPLTPFKWVRTTDLLFQVLLRGLPWFNWTTHSASIIRSELMVFPKVEIAMAKTGFWLRYPVQNPNVQILVEIFVRTVT